MEHALELTEDIQLSFRSVSAKQGHFGTSTNDVASEHRVVYRKWGARRRFFGILPPKQLPREEQCLPIPEEITTETELWDYVKKHKPHWLHGSHRERRAL